MAEGFITRKGGKGGVDVSDANAVESEVLQGKTFYAGDEEIKTGTIPSKGAETFTPGTTNQTISSGQFLSGTQTILGDSDLQAGNIKSGVNIFGVTGNLSSNPLPQRVKYWSGTEFVTWTASPVATSSNITCTPIKLSDRLRVTLVRPSSGGSAGANSGFTATVNLSNIDFIIADMAHYGSGNRNSSRGSLSIVDGTDLRTATRLSFTNIGYFNSFTNPEIYTAVLDVSGFTGNQIVALRGRGSSFNAFNHNFDIFNVRLARMD